MRLSAHLLGVFSPSMPQQRHRLQALCAPWFPDSPPLSETSGERDPGSRLGHGIRRRAWQSVMQVRSGILVKQVDELSCVKAQRGPQVFHEDCHRQQYKQDSRLPHRSLIVAWWIVSPCVLLSCYQVDMLFYSGEVSLSCKWKTRPQQQSRRRLWIALGMKRRERGYSEHDSFPSLSARLDLNTLSQSRREKCFSPSHCWLSLSSFLFAIKCISNGTTVQKAFLIRRNSIAFNLLCNGFAIFEYSYYEEGTIKTYLWIENAIQLTYCFIEN